MISFKIADKEAIKYSKISGDINKIHTNDKIGYNSIFGEKICHGTLAAIKILKLINIEKIIKTKKKFSIDIKFKNHIRYNNKISILKKENIYSAFQDLREVVDIKTNFKNPSFKSIQFPKYKKNQF